MPMAFVEILGTITSIFQQIRRPKNRMDFLETCNFPKFNHEAMDNPNIYFKD